MPAGAATVAARLSRLERGLVTTGGGRRSRRIRATGRRYRYRWLQDGDLVDIETEASERLDDRLAVGREAAVSLMGFGLELD